MSFTDEEKLLFRAVINNDIGTFENVLFRNPEYLKTFFMRRSLLHHAVENQSVKSIDKLLELGVNVDIASDNTDPDTPLNIAAQDNLLEMARLLLAKGANIEGIGSCPPLLSAIISGHLDMVKLLVQHGANTNFIFSNYEKPMTPIQVAEYWGKSDIVEYLREVTKTDFDPVILDKDPITAHIEAIFGKSDNLSLQTITGEISIIIIPPVTEEEPLILVTKGLSNHAMNVPDGSEEYRFAELIMYLPNLWKIKSGTPVVAPHSWPAEWLLRLAEYPKSNNTWLGSEKTVIEVGNPLAQFVKFTGFLLSHEPDDWGTLQRVDGSKINFYTVFPLYQSEIEYEKKYGVDELIKKFMEADIDTVIKPNRVNSVE